MQDTTTPAAAGVRWSREAIAAWRRAAFPLIGVNHVPRNAVNATEMWQEDGFRPALIDQELGWAAGYGYNGLRVFLSQTAWEEAPEAVLGRIRAFLGIADRHGLRVLPVFFDDVAFSGRQPYRGRQDEPRPGVHNSAWVPCPGHDVVRDPARWPEARAFVAAVAGALRADPRIVGWDLYNEPGNGGMFEASLPFMEAAAGWLRAARPTQPITIGVWQGHRGEFTERMWARAVALSDFLSFHCYVDPDGMAAMIGRLLPEGRPIVCTEWLHRPRGNHFSAMLPIFERHELGHMHWGLVAGRTQTNLLWTHDIGVHSDRLWLADVLRADGTPYDAAELALLRAHAARVAGRVRAAGP